MRVRVRVGVGVTPKEWQVLELKGNRAWVGVFIGWGVRVRVNNRVRG